MSSTAVSLYQSHTNTIVLPFNRAAPTNSIVNQMLEPPVVLHLTAMKASQCHIMLLQLFMIELLLPPKDSCCDLEQK